MRTLRKQRYNLQIVSQTAHKMCLRWLSNIPLIQAKQKYDACCMDVEANRQKVSFTLKTEYIPLIIEDNSNAIYYHPRS